MNPDLTPAQHKVLACLQREWRDGRAVGSLDALCSLLGLRSRGALHRHLEALVAAGWVAPLDRHRLGLRPGPLSRTQPAVPNPMPTARPLPRPQPALKQDALPAALRAAGVSMRALPRLGRIAAGAPLDAVFEEEPVLVPERLVPGGDAYVLEVRGDSMLGDGIVDGDLVIVEVDPHVRPGEVAVVLVSGEGATLKRFRHEGAMVRLMASNPAVADQLVPADQVAIQGRVSGLMRSYRS